MFIDIAFDQLPSPNLSPHEDKVCWLSISFIGKTNFWLYQSILKEISPECSLEGLMLKLKLQCFGHLMRRADSWEKTLMLGKIEGRRRRGWQRLRWLDGITNSWTWVWVNSGSWWWTGRPGVLQSMWSQRVRHNWVTELNWCYMWILLRVNPKRSPHKGDFFF